MTVAGQPEVTYHYDLQSNRLLYIQKGTSSVSFGYDNDNRRTSMTLPNGIVVSYVYDAGSRLNGLTYQLNGTTLGALIYSYDAAGRRTQVNGSLARTGLPPALTVATYDADNEVASWNGTPFAYDNDGNRTSDGNNTYNGTARGQLTGMAGPVNAAFADDAFGRRTGKLIGSQNTGFAYNGGAITQEINGTQVTNLWNGGTSFFQRTDPSGNSTVPITDALGSVLALADPNGNLLTQYTYDPYGATTTSGAPSNNPFQYIGQENDLLTGLYYLHARYYSPALMRFISEDPFGYFGGDMNFHAYAWKSPTNVRDPNGTEPVEACIIGGLVNANVEAWKNVFAGRKNNDLSVIGQNFVSGCVQGVLMEVLLINRLLGWAGVKVFSLGLELLDAAAPKALTEGLEALAEATCGGCLPAATPIHTKHGLVPIEKIKIRH